MSEIGIYRVDAAWAPAGHEGVEPHPVSFLVLQGIGNRDRAAVVLRADPPFLGALLDGLPLSWIREYASENAVRRGIQSALDGFKQDLEALMREAKAPRARIYPDETSAQKGVARGKAARGVAITGFFMQRESTVRRQAGGTRVHVMTFGVRSPTEASTSLDLSQLLRGATQAIQTKREKGRDINELVLISPALYNRLLSLRRDQIEAEKHAGAKYREIAAWIGAMSQDIQDTLGLIRGGRLVGGQGLSLEIVEGIAFSLENPGDIPSPKDPIAAIFVWDVAERFVAAQETGEYLVLRWPSEGRRGRRGGQAQEGQE